MSAAADLYTRCPDCGFIAPAESIDYTLTPDDGIDWDRPVRVTCLCCHASHHFGAGDVLPLDAQMTCHRCGAAAACPAGAARVQCPGCGLFLLGPDLTAAQRDELVVTEGLAGLTLRETYLAAKEPGRAPIWRRSWLTPSGQDLALSPHHGAGPRHVRAAAIRRGVPRRYPEVHLGLRTCGALVAVPPARTPRQHLGPYPECHPRRTPGRTWGPYSPVPDWWPAGGAST